MSYGFYSTSQVQSMMESGSLQPLPIKQALQPLFNILFKPAIAEITHSDGSYVNQTNVLSTALKGYREYCTNFGCDMATCASIIKLDDVLYHQIPREIGGKRTYKEDNGDRYVFYSNGWRMAPDFVTTEPILETLKCPQNSISFEEIQNSVPSIPNVKNWQECSLQCLKDPNSCNFWQYSLETKICTLIEDYSSTSYADKNVYTGSRDCPGDMEKYNSAYGLCVENMESKSMWRRAGQRGFDKFLKVEGFDPNSFIVAGGAKSDRQEILLYS